MDAIKNEVLMKNILIVDDTYANRLLLKEIIKKIDNVKFIEAQNGKEAIDKFTKNDVHLILMDIMMPVMGGVDSMYFIRRELKSKIPIIAVTAYSDYDQIINCGENSFNKIITKPVDFLKLIELIKNYLQ